MLTANDIALMIDHSLLKPELDVRSVRAGCEVALKHGVASACVKPCDLPVAAEVLRGSAVKLSTVVGFPHGSSRTDVKVFEAERALDDGAVELDMVLNIGRLRSGELGYVEREIRAVVEAASRRGAIVKVILENAYLDDAMKREACRALCAAGAAFAKTSTGYAPSGATAADLALMRASCPPSVAVKAAGGARVLDAVLSCRALGCSRCGATATEAIMEEALRREAAGTLREIDPKDAVLGTGY